jgi:hypothetical protein
VSGQVLAPVRGDDHEPSGAPAHRSPYLRLLVGAGVAALVWQLLPNVPRDQTVVFVLGNQASTVARLDVSWELAEGGHEGGFTLNFPSPAPERVVRQLRLAEGEYVFHVSAARREAAERRTELTRQVTLSGDAVTLRIEDLSE